MVLRVQQDQQKAAEISALLSDADRVASSVHLPRLPFPALSPHHPSRARPFSGPDREFWQFRPYQNGDNIRAIDWRRSAAHDDVFIKERQRHDHINFSLWLDTRPAMMDTADKPYRSKYLHGVMIALALSNLITEQEATLIPLLDPRPVTGQTTARMAQAMTSPTPRFAAPDDLPHLDIPSGTLLLISDFWEDSEQWQARLSLLSARMDNILLLQIASFDEWMLPFTTRTRLTDPSAAVPPQTIESFDALRPLYQDRLRAHTTAMQDVCRATRAHFYTTRPDLDAAPLLYQLLSLQEQTA